MSEMVKSFGKKCIVWEVHIIRLSGSKLGSIISNHCLLLYFCNIILGGLETRFDSPVPPPSIFGLQNVLHYSTCTKFGPPWDLLMFVNSWWAWNGCFSGGDYVVGERVKSYWWVRKVWKGRGISREFLKEVPIGLIDEPARCGSRTLRGDNANAVIRVTAHYYLLFKIQNFTVRRTYYNIFHKTKTNVFG